MMWKIAWICLSLSLLIGGVQGEESSRLIDVYSGSDVVLECNVANSKNIELINWRLNNSKSPFFIKFMSVKPFIADQFKGRLHIVNQSAILISGVSHKDSGTYRCRAMMISTTGGGGVFEQGTPIKLNVQGNHQVIRKTSKEGFPAVLDCNIDSSISTTNARFIWTKNGTEISPSTKTGISVLVGGKLYIKNCSRKDSGVYKCTARTLDPTGSSILSHRGQTVFLDVQFPPDIILIEDVASAAEGSDARLPCVSKANPGTVSTTWSRGGRELAKPKYEVLQEGTLLVRSIKTSDAGTYTCTPSNSIGKGKSKSTRLVILPRITHVPPSVETVFIAKPGAPTITMISRSDTTVTISWIPGYDIGPIQTFEVWYKKLSDTDSQWKTRYLPPSPTTYTLSDLEFGGKYWFAVRGLNKEAAGNFSRTVIYDTNGPQQVLYLLAPHVVSQHKPTNYVIPIVAGVLGSIIFVLLLCIACFCFKRYYGRKKPEDKVWRKFYFLRRDRKKRSKNDDKQIHEDVSEMEGDVPTARRQLEEQQEGSQSLHVDIENPSLKTSKDEDQIVSSGRVHADNQSNDESNEPKPDIVTNQGVVYIALDKDPPPDYQEVKVTYYREWRQ